ncbi:MAG: DUF4347 domain-containing protein [Gammaproteobacteria bacterium]|nr:MAG: DUF4347 domain-containing protein [Gammaproteobacteria bacterium]
MKHLDDNESQIINKSKKAKRQKKKLVDIIFGILSVKDKDRSTELSTLMQPLEPRFMFDGAAVETVDIADGVSETEQSEILKALNSNDKADASDSLIEAIKTEALNQETDYSVYKEVVIIDSRVKDPQTLIKNISRKASVEVIDVDENGVDAITQMLSKYSNLDAIHIISHGSQGELYLGSSVLNLDSLSSYQMQLGQWGNAISSSGDLLFYGCNVAEGSKGMLFIDALKSYTSADIAASTDITGADHLGGDSILEIDEQVEVDEIVTFSNFGHILADPELGGFTQIGSDINPSLNNEQFGSDIAVNATGSHVVVGAMQSDIAGTNKGAVRVYEWNGSNWVQVGGDITLVTPTSNANFGRSVTISDDGLTVAAGADQDLNSTGTVEVHEWNGSAWVQKGTDLTGASTADLFGWSVTLDGTGDWLAVGEFVSATANTGQVNFYEWNGSAWVSRGSIVGAGGSDRLGMDIQFSQTGNRIVMGAHTANSNAGYVRVYEYAGGSTWNLMGSQIDGSAGGGGDMLGHSVSMNSDGTRIILSAPIDDAGGSNTGTVRVYDWNGAAWVQLGSDIYGEANNDLSGGGFQNDGSRSVSMSGDGNRIAIGSHDNDGNGSGSGHIRIFDWDGSDWIQVGPDIDGGASGDAFGWSVSLSRDGSVVGGGSLTEGSNRGEVRLYSLDGVGTTHATYSENTLLTLEPLLTITDTDDSIVGATIQITGNYQAFEDILSIATSALPLPAGIQTTFDRPSGLYQISGTATVAVYQNLLRNIQYENGKNDPTDLERTIKWTVDDGTATSSIITRITSLVAINDLAKINTFEQLGSTISGGAFERFGESVSFSNDGTRVAIGGPDSGDVVRVYDWDGSNWVQLGSDITIASSENFGESVALNADGTVVVIGDSQFDGSGSDSGQTNVFEWNGAAWVLRGAAINGLNADDESGNAVAINDAGDRIIIGESRFGASNDGQARVFDWNGSAWVQLGTTFAAAATGDQFGFSVAMNSTGSRISIGAAAHGDGVFGAEVGEVKIYEWNGSAWVQLGSDLVGSQNDEFSGYSVALDALGDNVAIGSFYGDSATNLDAGTVRVYNWNGSAWVQQGSDIHGLDGGDWAGFSVSLSDSGTRLAIGALESDQNGNQSGHVTIYDWNGSAWMQYGEIITGNVDDHSGASVSLSGDGLSLAIGEVGDFSGDNGQVRIFDLTALTALDYTEGDGAVAIHTSFNISDPDDTNIETATIVIATNYQNGEDILNFVDTGSITSSWTAATGTLVLLGTDTLANYKAALEAVTFENTSTTPNTSTRTVEFYVNDGDGNSVSIAERDITVTDINEAPELYFSYGNAQLGADIDGTTDFGLFGEDVSISDDGTRIAVGAPLTPFNVGSVRIYDWNGTNWVQTGSDITGGSATRLGHAVSLSADGSIVAVGASYANSPAVQQGYVQVYQWNGASWVQLGSDISGELGGDFSGDDIDLSADGTRVAIGAIFNDGNGPDSGQVRVYDWNGSAWVQAGSDIDGEATGDQSGTSVALSSDGLTLVIGAPFNDDAALQAGHARVYSWNGSAWVQQGSDIDGDTNSDFSGNSVSVNADGSRVAVGTYAGGGTGEGRARIYDWNGSAWVQVGSDIVGEAAGDQAGWTVSLTNDGDRIVIGSRLGEASNEGHVRVFDWNGSAWVENGTKVTGDSSSEYHANAMVSGDGSTLVVGAINAENTGNDRGRVRVYELETTEKTLTFTENDSALTIDDSFTILDIDDTNMESATIAISANYVQGEDFLSFTPVGSIIGSFDATTGSLVLTGTDTLANYELALASVTYDNISNDPSVLQRQIDFYVNDGDTQSNASIAYINVAPVNDAPNLELVDFNQLGVDLDGEAAGDLAGFAVDISDDGLRIVVGAKDNDGNGSDSGQARVYEWDGTTWNQLGADLDGEAAGDEFGTTVSISADGDRIAVGARYNDGSATDAGHVRIFDWNGSAWVQVGADIDGEGLNDFSGGDAITLSADGSRVAIGATGNNDAGNDSGHVRIYEYNGTSWVQLGSDIDGENIDDWFGNAVSFAAEGTRLAIGGYRNDDAGGNAGHVRVYDWDGANWVQVGADLDGLAADDWFGKSVSLSEDGNRLAVGAFRSDVSALHSGQVIVYDWNGAAWIQAGSTIDGVVIQDNLGQQVSLSSDGLRMALSVIGDDTNGSSSGKVNIYDWNADTNDWELVGASTAFGADILGEASPDALGWSLALTADGSRIVIGAPFNDGNGANSGHVRVFELTSATLTTAVTFTEDAGAIAAYPEFSIIDPDDTDMESATIAITNNFVASEDVLAFTDTANITGSWNPVAGILTLTGTDTKAAYEQALASVTYNNTSDTPDTNQRTVSFYVNDGDAQSNVATSLIDIVAANDPPELGIFEFSQLGIDIDGEAADDHFGHANSLSGDGSRIAIGSPVNNDGAALAGHVRVFDWDGSSWVQVGSDLDGENGNDSFGTSVSLSDDGNRLAVGIIFYDASVGNSNEGQVKIYDWDGTNWVQVGNDIDGEAAVDYSGGSVALSANGNRVVIGAANNDGGGGSSGHMRVYEYNGSAWVQLGADIDGFAINQQLGDEVAISADGNRVAGAAPDINGNYVVIYEWDGASWNVVGSAIGNGSSTAGFGISLTDDGNRIAIGSPEAASDAGRVRIYDWNGAAWVQAGSDIIGEAANDLSGGRKRVSITGDGSLLAIGATLNGLFNNGHVRLYQWDGIDWVQVGNDINGESADDRSGFQTTISRDGSRVAIGAINNNGINGADSGHVRVYQLTTSTPTIALNYTIGDGQVVVQDELAVADVDDDNMESATIYFSNNYVNGEDVLSFTPTVNISFSWTAATGTLVLTGTDTKAAYAEALASVTYENIGASPTASIREVTYLVDDGDDPSNNVTADINVIVPNTPPELDFVSFEQVSTDILAEAVFGDNFGYAVAASSDGSIVAISDRTNSEGGSARGDVRIFELQAGSWVQLGDDIGGVSNGDQSGWSVDLSDDGMRVVIGAPVHNGSAGTDSGHARIFEYNGTAWVQLGSAIEGQAAQDRSGWSVSISADGARVAVGAVNNADAGAGAGQVRIYEWNGSAWVQLGNKIDGTAAGDNMGSSVALSSDGSFVVVGARHHDGDRGQVQVYELIGVTWTQLGSDIDGSAASDESGTSVAINDAGNRIAIGAPFNGANNGQIRVYDWNGSAWVQAGTDMIGEGNTDQLGLSVSLSGDGNRVAAGGPFNDVGGTISDDKGYARIFDWDGSSWTQLNIDLDGTSDDDHFGTSVGISSNGERLVVGAPMLSGDGYARVFDLTSTFKTLAYTENDGAVALHPEYKIVDSTDTDMESATIEFTANYVQGEDVLVFVNTANISGSFDSQTGRLVLTGTDTIANYQLALASITYENLSDNPLPATNTKTIDMLVDDGDVPSNLVTLQIDVTPVNDAPQLDLVNFAQMGADILGDAANDQAGQSVTVSEDGNRIAIGYTSLLGGDGYVRAFEWDGSSWSQMGADFLAEAVGDEFGNWVSISADGNRLAIGGLENDAGGSNAGHVRIFEWDGSSWNQLGTDIDGVAVNEVLGTRVALNKDGSILSAGAAGSDTVRNYSFDGSSWNQLGADIVGEASGDEFGHALAISDSGYRIVVGGRENDDGGSNAGHVRVFDFDGTSWVQVGADLDGAAANSFFGIDVSITADGNRIAVGAVGVGVTGATYIYDWDGASWNQVGSTIAGEPIEGNLSGHRISLSSDGLRLSISDRTNSGGGLNAGSVRIYDWDGTASDWVLVGGSTAVGSDIDGDAANDEFGWSTRLSGNGDRVIIGAYENDANGNNAGQVKVFDLVSESLTTVALAYTENDPATAIYPEFSILDVDDTDMESATIAITGNYVQGEDYLAFSDTANITGNFDYANGILYLTGTDTIAAYEAALASVTYENTSEDPSILQRIVQYTVNDGDDQSNIATALIDITATNDAPDLGLVDFQQLGTDLDGEAADDRFGSSVATNLDGSRIVVGATLNDGSASNAGSTRVYDWNGSAWVQVGSDIDGEAADDESGLAVAMSEDGLRIAIGARLNDGTASNAGHVRVFEWDGSSWNQLGLDIDGEAGNDESGSHISMSSDGSTVAIGAIFNNGLRGHVRIYDWDGSSWIQRGLDIDGAGGDRSGAVAISSDGNRVIVGRHLNDVGGNNSGQAVVYDWDGTSWTQVGATIDGTNFEGRFGITVSMNADGTRIAVGEDRFDGFSGGSLRGWTYVYDWDGVNWVQAGTVIPGSGNGDDGFYMSLNADGNRMAIGGPFNNGNGSDSGNVRIYDWDISISDWVLVSGNDIDGEAADDQSGSSVALSRDGKRVVIGAPLNDGNGGESGHVRVYELVSVLETVNYTEDTGAVAIYPEFSIIDADDSDMESATIAITNNFLASEDSLAFVDTANITGSYNSSTGVLTLTGTDTRDAYEAALASVTYENTSDNPDTNQRQVDFYVNDGDVQSNVATVNIDITPVNDPPVLTLTEISSFLDINGEAVGDSNDGSSVEFNADGSRLIFGAQSNDGAGSLAGHARVFEFDGSNWVQLGSDIDGDAAGDQLGKENTVAINDAGDIIAVGAIDNDTHGSNAGVVRVYQYDGSDWVQLGSDISGTATSGQRIGYAVDLSADGLRVAAGTNQRNVQIFDWDGANWVQVGATIAEPAASAFGYELKLSADGDRVAVGAWNASSMGAVYAYDWDGANWTQTGTTILGDNSGDRFGESLDLSDDGNILAVGAIGHDLGGALANAGKVRVYQWNGSSWVQLGSDLDGEAANDESGIAVSLNAAGDLLAIGAQNNDDGGVNTGQVRLYSWDGVDWVQVGSDIDGTISSGFMGEYVALSGDGSRLAATIPQSPNGSVRAFDIQVTSSSTPLAYTEGDSASVIFSDFNITDVDDTDMESATVTISANYVQNEDLLLFTNTANISGTFDTVTGRLILTGTDTKANYEAALATVEYFNTSEDPSTATRTVDFLVDDGDDPSNNASIDITVAAVNNAPELDLIDLVQVGSDIDGIVAGEISGWSVSADESGTRVAIGAPLNDGGGSDRGQVRVYDWDGSSWNLAGSAIDGDADDDQSGYSVTLSADGQRLAIGAIFNDDAGSNAGQVRIFEWDGSNWVQLGLDLDGEAAGDRFGESVALTQNGDRVIVGAWQNDGVNGANSGHARVYQWTGTAWIQLGSDLDGEAAGDAFGRSVAIDAAGNRIAVGGDLNDAGGAGTDNRGHVRIYQYDGTDWVQIGADIDGQAAGVRSGTSIAFNGKGDRLIIGDVFNSDAGAFAGQARVFEYDGANWNQIGSDLLGENAGDQFGTSVSISRDGQRITVSAENNDDAGNNAGHVRIFDWNNDTLDWVQIGGMDIDGEAADDQSGHSIALSAYGYRVIIGAPGNDDGGTGSGHVRVYDIVKLSETYTYNENDGVLALNNEFSVTDIDDEHIESATVSMTVATYQASEDVLSYDAALATSMGVTGNIVSGVITFTSDTANTVTKSEYEALLATVTYENTSEDPNETTRVLRYSVNDGDTESNIATINIDVVSVNDPPEISLGLQQLGLDIDGEAVDDLSGSAVAINGDGTRIAVGAPNNDGNGSNSGHVRIFDWNGTAWVQLGTDIDGEAANDFSGSNHSRVSMSVDGDTVAIAAFGNDGNGSNSGHVRIYNWNGAAWVQLGADIDGEAANDQSGSAISLSADGLRLAIGAHFNDDSALFAGHVRVFEWDGFSWNQMGVDIDGEAAGDRSGNVAGVSLNADGSRLAVGAPYNDGNGADSGHVRIFDWNGAAWVQLGVDIDGGAAGDRFGWSTSLSADGNRVAIGADNAGAVGQVSIYDWNGSNWVQVGLDIDGELSDGGAFGTSVSLSADGSRVAIGDHDNDGEGVGSSNRGSVRIYEWDGLAWNQLFIDIDGEANSDQSGRSIGLSADGSRVIIGAHNNDDNGNNSGHARVYTFEATTKNIDYSEGVGALIVADTVAIDDVDDTDMESATIEISGNYVIGEDILAFTDTANITGTWMPNIGRLLLQGTDTKAAYETALESITYQNLSDNPDTTQRQVDFYVNDGDDPSNLATIFIDITATNDAPEVALVDFEQLGGDIDGLLANDQIGFNVAMSADGLIVAASSPFYDGAAGADSGLVRVFQWDGSSWNQLGLDIEGVAADDSNGRGMALSADGMTLAIGALDNDIGGADSGHVRIFDYSGTAWVQRGSDILGETASDRSGVAVSLSDTGDAVAIGAYLNDGVNGADSGHVRVYFWNGTAWAQAGSDIDGEAAGDNSGWSVDLNADGDRVIIGARANAAGGTDRGHARVYEFSGGSWSQLGLDIDGDADRPFG